MPFYPEDNKYGLQKEDEVLPIITKFFGKDIKKSINKKAIFDFECDDCVFELKSRKNDYKKYPTTMIGCNKLNSTKKIILLFGFTDGLYYIEYDEEKFKLYERKPFSRSRMSCHNQDYIYIPIEDLKELKINENSVENSE